MLSKVLNDCDRYNAELVAVSKTKSCEEILEIYHQGQRAFGENRVQELVEKYNELPKDIYWHFIGNLQSNKVKNIVPFVHLIHSVDRKSLLKAINKEAKNHSKNVDILLQLKIAKEETKGGASMEELDKLIQLIGQDKYPNINLRGFMGMATFTDDKAMIEEEFNLLKSTYESYKKQLKSSHFNILSMGMSGDYLIALETGSTLVRVGSLIFGKR